jgi:hypothetical protein
MIIKDNKRTAAINNTSSLSRVITYNENKIHEGFGRILYGDLDDHFLDEARKFENEMSKNPNSANGIFMHIPISFHPDDKVNEKDMVLITVDYLQKKNVNLANVVIIEHYDKPHPHLHVILINRNDDFKYNRTYSKMGSVRETIAFCRQKEKEYGYVEVLGNNTKHQNYNETNAIKFSLQNAILKYSHLFLEKLPYLNREIRYLKNKGVSNDEFKKDHERAFFLLFQFAKSNKLIYTSRKSKVEELIDQNILGIRKDPYNFEHPELYVRVIKNTHIQYGLKSESYYINESKLPVQYHLDFLKGKKKVTPLAGKIYVKNVLDSFKASGEKTPNALIQFLEENSIQIIKHRNSDNKIFGFSYDFQGDIHKASDIGKEYSLFNLIEIPVKTEVQVIKPTPIIEENITVPKTNLESTNTINPGTQAGASTGVNKDIEDIENRSKMSRGR